jgi:hypothetical protein
METTDKTAISTDSERISYLQKEILTLNQYISEIPEDVKAVCKRNELTDELTALQNKNLFENELKKLGRNRIEEIITPAPDPAVILILEPTDMAILKACFNYAIGVADCIDCEESSLKFKMLKTKIATQAFAQNKIL